MMWSRHSGGDGGNRDDNENLLPAVVRRNNHRTKMRRPLRRNWQRLSRFLNFWTLDNLYAIGIFGIAANVWSINHRETSAVETAGWAFHHSAVMESIFPPRVVHFDLSISTLPLLMDDPTTTATVCHSALRRHWANYQTIIRTSHAHIRFLCKL